MITEDYSEKRKESLQSGIVEKAVVKMDKNMMRKCKNGKNDYDFFHNA